MNKMFKESDWAFKAELAVKKDIMNLKNRLNIKFLNLFIAQSINSSNKEQISFQILCVDNFFSYLRHFDSI